MSSGSQYWCGLVFLILNTDANLSQFERLGFVERELDQVKAFNKITLHVHIVKSLVEQLHVCLMLQCVYV